MWFKYRAVTGLLAKPIAQRRVLTVCCGSGMDAEFLERDGAEVVGLDLSLGALERARQRARRYGLRYRLVCGDAEHLPFAARAFHAAFVHDGLHHLDAPETSIGEMARVAAEAVLITEPADATLTRLAIRLGVIPEREDSGNLVARFTPDVLRPLLARRGFASFRHRRYLMKYGHPPGEWVKWLDSPLAFALARVAFLLVGATLAGRFGNKLSFAALRL